MITFKPFVDGSLEMVGGQAEDQSPKFSTSLQLAPERVKWLEQLISRRISEVRDEMGIDHEGRVTLNGWMEIRKNNQDSYNMDWTWRESKGGVFKESNYSLGSNKRYVRLTKAKACDDILGTKPYFSVFGDSQEEDEDLIFAVERKAQEAVENSNVTASLREAIKLALIRNECVVKTTYLRKATNFIGPAAVMIDDAGNPILTPAKGFFVMQNDDFVADPDTQGLFRLKKDPSFSIQDPKQTGVQPQFHEFKELQQESVTYDGPDVRPLDYRDFLCPLRVASVHEADINVHTYSEDPEVVKALYGDIDISARFFEEYESGVAQEIDAMGERGDTLSSQIVEKMMLGEVYIRADADEDGSAEEIFAVMELTGQRLIYWEYLPNVMKKRPFEVVVGIEKVPGRWYGVGIYTMMEHSETYIDAQFNRYNLKDSTTASATFIHADAVKEWETQQPILGGTNFYRIINSEQFNRNNPPIFRVNLNEQSETGERLMRIMQQAGDLQFGQISAEDASASRLNSSNTATGNMIIERSSNALTRETENEMSGSKNSGGIEAILDQVVDVTLENMDTTEMMFTKDGKKLLTLNRDEIRSLSRNVKLLLTRMKSAESIQSSQQALAVAKDYLSLRKQDPATAKILRPEYIRQLKALQVDDADDRCPVIGDDEIQAWKQAQQQAQQPPQKPESLSISYKDAPPPIQRQMEARAGFQPVTPEQEAQTAIQASAPPQGLAQLQ